MERKRSKGGRESGITWKEETAPRKPALAKPQPRHAAAGLMRRRAIPTQSIANVESNIGHGLVCDPNSFCKKMRVSRWSQIQIQRAYIQYVIRVLAVGFRTAGKEGKGAGGHTLGSARRDEEELPRAGRRLSRPLPLRRRRGWPRD